MTKAELKEALDLYFDDDEVVVCANDEDDAWDNITRLGRVNGTAAIFFGGGSAFSDE